jgi:hypothetical protein
MIKVVEQNYKGSDYDLMVHGDNKATAISTSGTLLAPDNGFQLAVGQYNDTGLTAMLNSVDTFVMIEFVRPL